MNAAIDMITDKQVKKVWYEAKQLGLLPEDIHTVLKNDYGCESLKDMTKRQAMDFIDALVMYTSDKSSGYGMITSRQKWKIEDLSKKLGWEPERLNNFIKKWGHVDNIKWLSDRDASGVITGLERILKNQGTCSTKESEAF